MEGDSNLKSYHILQFAAREKMPGNIPPRFPQHCLSVKCDIIRPIYLVYLVHLVYLVYLVCLVCLVYFVYPKGHFSSRLRSGTREAPENQETLEGLILIIS